MHGAVCVKFALLVSKIAFFLRRRLCRTRWGGRGGGVNSEGGEGGFLPGWALCDKPTESNPPRDRFFLWTRILNFLSV